MNETEKLILAIEKEECLWNVNSPSFLQKKIKNEAWYRIGQEIAPEWGDLSHSDRRIALQGIKNRWTHIKDYYKREKQLKTKYFSKRKSKFVMRRKYVFTDILGFLDSTINAAKNKLTTQPSTELNESSNSAAFDEITTTALNTSTNNSVLTSPVIKNEIFDDDTDLMLQCPENITNVKSENFQNRRFLLEISDDSNSELPRTLDSCHNFQPEQPILKHISTPTARLCLETSESFIDTNSQFRQTERNQSIAQTFQQNETENLSRQPMGAYTSNRSIINSQQPIPFLQPQTTQCENQVAHGTYDLLRTNPNVTFLVSCAQDMDEMTPYQRIEFKSGIINLLREIKFPDKMDVN